MSCLHGINHPIAQFFGLEMKRQPSTRAEYHYAQYPLITVIDMCLFACRLDLETTVVVLSVRCDLGRFLCC